MTDAAYLTIQTIDLRSIADGAAGFANLIATTANFFAIAVDPAATFLEVAGASDAVATLTVVSTRTSIRSDGTNCQCAEHAKTDNAGSAPATGFGRLRGSGKP